MKAFNIITPLRFTSLSLRALSLRALGLRALSLRALSLRALGLAAVLAVVPLALFPLAAQAQGRVAVVNLDKAIIETDLAQKRLSGLRNTKEFKANKAEFDKLQSAREKQIKKLQKDLAVMSASQQQEARKQLANTTADLEHVLRKLQQSEQEVGAKLLQEMGPKVQDVLLELIKDEGIGLLIHKNAVIHADNGYSITTKVTDKLNQKAAQ